jgi:glycosyltransferase involved in cell wall biosynthesis
MRILQVAHGFPPSAQAGVELHCYWLSKDLVKRGHEVAVFCRKGGTELPDYSIIDDVIDGLLVRRVVNNYQEMKDTPLHIAFPLDYNNERIRALFEDYLEEFQPDIVHVQHCRGLSASVLESLRQDGLPHVLTLHDYWYLCQRVKLLKGDGSLCDGPEGGALCGRCQGLSRVHAALGDLRRYLLACQVTGELPTPLRKRLVTFWHTLVRVSGDRAYALSMYDYRTSHLLGQVRETAHLITPSNFAKDMYMPYGLPEERFRVIPYGVDTRRWEGFERKPSATLRFGFLGTLLFSKGVHVLLEAYRMARTPSTSLVLHGSEGGDPEYAERIRSLAKECGARLAGRYDNARLTEILSDIDVLVVPSLWHETYGIVVREGQLSGAPIIASRIGALTEAIREGVDGLLVEPGNSHELADKMRRFVEDPDLVSCMRKQFRSQVVTIAENAEMIERVYREAMS